MMGQRADPPCDDCIDGICTMNCGVAIGRTTRTWTPVPEPIAASEWKWYGFGGHFVGRSQCEFHMTTRIGAFLISTIGGYQDKRDGAWQLLGSDKNSLFETMVFECPGDDQNGDPITPNDCVEMERYQKSLAAEQGHMRYCLKYANHQPTETNR